MPNIRFCHVIDDSTFNPLLFNSIKFSDRERFDYTVISLRTPGELQEQMQALAVRSFSLGYTSRRQALYVCWRLIRFFRREKIDIVQTHLFDASLIGLAAARIAGVPVRIFTGHHSHETPLHGQTLLTLVDGISGRFLSNHTIAPSRQMKEIFERDLNVPERKIAVIPHGFDLEIWREAAMKPTDFRRELGIENKIVFGAVGRLYWIKDFPRLIEAFAQATASRDDVVLVIVGGGNQSDLYDLIAERSLVGKVILTGRREDIAAVMNQFDVLVHSSLAESFGMVFIEALALGKPIVTTSVGVVPEIAGYRGRDFPAFLCNASDTQSLTTALKKMLERQGDWTKMKAEAKRISEQFSIRLTQAQCDEAYLKWIGEG